VIVFDLADGSITINEACVGTAYAGQPPHVNDASATHLHGLGPLPVGLYTIEPPQDYPQSVGEFAMHLVPDPSNDMTGRDPTSFFIHGPNAAKDVNGAQLSSDGCPVAARPIRVAIWGDPEHLLSVVA
jgi:hypothetical protein